MFSTLLHCNQTISFWKATLHWKIRGNDFINDGVVVYKFCSSPDHQLSTTEKRSRYLLRFCALLCSEITHQKIQMIKKEQMAIILQKTNSRVMVSLDRVF